MRLLLDEHFSPAIANQLTGLGHGVMAAAAVAELRHQDDAAVLAWAVGQQRAVVTEDAADYHALHGRRGIGKLVRALDGLLRGRPAHDALRADARWL